MPSKTTAPDPSPAPEVPPPVPSRNRFFTWMRSLGIQRQPGWIGGVCAGIATRLGIDPLIVRGIAVVVAVLGGPALLIYAAAWLLLPDEHDTIHLEELFHGRVESPIAGIGALVLLSMLPVTQGFWFAGSAFWGEPYWGAAVGRAVWTIVVLGLVIALVVWIARRSQAKDGVTGPVTSPATTDARPETIPDLGAPPAPEVAAWRDQQSQVRAEQDAFRNQQASDRAAANRAAAERSKLDRALKAEAYRAERARTRSNPLYSFIVIGIALVAGGLTVLTFGDDALTSARSWIAGIAASLGVLAIGIIINGVLGRRSGGASGVAALLVFSLAVLAVSTAAPMLRIGAQTFTPVNSPAEGNGQANDFAAGAGTIVLDLTQYYASTTPATTRRDDYVDLRVGAGQVTVYVPDDTNVNFVGTVGAGQVEGGPNERVSRVGPAVNASEIFEGTDPRTINVTVQLGAGLIRVVETPEGVAQ